MWSRMALALHFYSDVVSTGFVAAELQLLQLLLLPHKAAVPKVSPLLLPASELWVHFGLRAMWVMAGMIWVPALEASVSADPVAGNPANLADPALVVGEIVGGSQVDVAAVGKLETFNGRAGVVVTSGKVVAGGQAGGQAGVVTSGKAVAGGQV